METQYNVLSYRVDLYINDYKLGIEIDWNVHNDRNIGYKRKRQKSIKQDLGCKFILALILRNKILIFLFWYFYFDFYFDILFLELSTKYLDISCNQLKKL